MIFLDAEIHHKTSYREWASQFSGKFFVMIQVFADESGTHDPLGVKTGSRYPIIAGFAAKKSVWDKTTIAWKAMLKKYEVPYFHGREVEGARLLIVENRPRKGPILENPYVKLNWGLDRIESFKNSMTKIAAMDNKIPIIGGIDLKVFNNVIETLSEKYPYKYSMSEFFRVYHYETAIQWGDFKSDVHFFFDWNENKEWKEAIHEVFATYQNKDNRMRGPYFDHKTKLIALQVADLLAYRVRRLFEDIKTDQYKEFDPNDLILLKNLLRSAMIMYPDLKEKIQNPKVKKYLK